MGEFKGTKGEWIVNKGNNVVSKHNLPIAIVYDGYTAHGSFKNEDENDRKANAKLIACAPEMLEMLIHCEKVFRQGGGMEYTLADIQSLINKATL